MQYCRQCHLHLRGNRKRCVLCGKTLVSTDCQTGSEEVFPEIPPTYEKHLALRILVFISITAIAVSFAFEMMMPTVVNWPLFVIFGLFSTWLGFIVVLWKRHNIPKTILWQVVIVSLLSVFWDWQTGWRGWSLEYFIPIIYVAAEMVMYITARAMKIRTREYITYALLDGMFGIIPILFILFRLVDVLYPSILCVTVSIIFLAGIFIFQGENIVKELKKKTHI